MVIINLRTTSYPFLHLLLSIHSVMNKWLPILFRYCLSISHASNNGRRAIKYENLLDFSFSARLRDAFFSFSHFNNNLIVCLSKFVYFDLNIDTFTLILLNPFHSERTRVPQTIFLFILLSDYFSMWSVNTLQRDGSEESHILSCSRLHVIIWIHIRNWILYIRAWSPKLSTEADQITGKCVSCLGDFLSIFVSVVNDDLTVMRLLQKTVGEYYVHRIKDNIRECLPYTCDTLR